MNSEKNSKKNSGRTGSKKAAEATQNTPAATKPSASQSKTDTALTTTNDTSIKKTVKKQSKKSSGSIETATNIVPLTETKGFTKRAQSTIDAKTVKKSKKNTKAIDVSEVPDTSSSMETVKPVKARNSVKKITDDTVSVQEKTVIPETTTARKKSSRSKKASIAVENPVIEEVAVANVVVPETKKDTNAVTAEPAEKAIPAKASKKRTKNKVAQQETAIPIVNATPMSGVIDASVLQELLKKLSIQDLQNLISKKTEQMQTVNTKIDLPVTPENTEESVPEEKTAIAETAPKKKRSTKKASSSKKPAQAETIQPEIVPPEEVAIQTEPAKAEEVSVTAEPAQVETAEAPLEVAVQELPVPGKKKSSRKRSKKNTENDATPVEEIPVVAEVVPETTETVLSNSDTPEKMQMAESEAATSQDQTDTEQPQDSTVLKEQTAEPAPKAKKRRGRKPKSATQSIQNEESGDGTLSDKDIVMIIPEHRSATSDKKNAKALAKHASLAKNDTMKQYMGEIGSIPLVTKDQEVELASQIHGEDYEAQEKARDVLIKANLRLVVKIAHDFKGLGLPLLDLISEGNLGLMRAVMKFDPEKGAKFSSYAAWWIKQSMRRALANQSKTIRIPVQSAGKINKIKTSRAKLADMLGRDPTDAEIASTLDFSERTVAGLRLADLRTFSLHDPIQQGEEGEFQDIIPDRSAMTPERILGDEESKNRLRQILDELDEREQQIIKMRFGLDYNDGQGMTLEEVSQRIGRTRERVRQIQNQALAKLRNMLSDEAGFNND